MIDREKTIKTLNEIADYFEKCRQNASFGSTAEEHFLEVRSAARNAAELLKEQEPVKPTHSGTVFISNAMTRDDIVFEDSCGNCSCYILRKWVACPICGRRIDWDAETST